VEISHANFAEISGVIFIDVGSVMMLTTSHTTTTGVLSMLPYSTMAC
jgi:hypothetical protein